MKLTKAAQELGKKGGDSTFAKHGREHFVNAGKKGGKNRWKNRKKGDANGAATSTASGKSS